MLYTCDPRPRRLAAATKRGARKTSGPVIDIHCHIVSPEAAALVAASGIAPDEPMGRFSNEATRAVQKAQTETVRPMLTSVERRIADMDEMGVDIQAISPAPPQYFYWTPPELGRDAARLINDNIAATVAETSGPPGRSRHRPHAGAGVRRRRTRARGEDARPAWRRTLHQRRGRRPVPSRSSGKVFAKAEELGVLVFLHPNGFPDGRRFSEHYFSNVIGNPLDSTMAVSHLIFGGVLDAYPKLKICVAHGGGFLPAYAGRMDHAHGARSDCRLCIKKKPSWYLKKMYFDTIVFEESQLEHLVKTYGSDHILMGTDYPFDMGMYEPIEFVSGAKLTAADKQAILGGNAAKLLKLKSRRPAQAKG